MTDRGRHPEEDAIEAGDATERVETPGEHVANALRVEGLAPYAWSNGPGERYAAHYHGYDKVLVVADGSIVFGLPDDGEHVALGPGDRLDLPAGTVHDAIVGPAGVTCLEAQRPAASMGGPVRRSAGTWDVRGTGTTDAFAARSSRLTR